MNVVVNPLPTTQIISNSPVCVGQPINFTGSGGTTYAWSGPGLISNIQNPNISLSSMSNSGTYTLTVVDANNCVNSITQNVVVNPLPNPTAVGSTACENSNVTLSATGRAWWSSGAAASTTVPRRRPRRRCARQGCGHDGEVRTGRYGAV